jgi:hypothetical protein
VGKDVYVVMISHSAYNANFKQEDLASIAEHECQHARDIVSIQTAGTAWRAVDDFYGGTVMGNYVPLLEASAELVELNQDASFWYLREKSYFVNQYNGAITGFTAMTPGGGKDAAKSILQDIYQDIPFLEMKRVGYDWHVRAPQ